MISIGGLPFSKEKQRRNGWGGQKRSGERDWKRRGGCSCNEKKLLKRRKRGNKIDYRAEVNCSLFAFLCNTLIACKIF